MSRGYDVWIQEDKIYKGRNDNEQRKAKAFRTTSSEALCILAGTTPIIIRMEEAVKQYFLRKRKGT